MRKDRVTEDLYWFVRSRDDFRCVAPRLGAEGTCQGPIELDHVKDRPHVGAPVVKRERSTRAPSDSKHLVSLCHAHHQDGWATSHRPELRTYLAERA